MKQSFRVRLINGLKTTRTVFMERSSMKKKVTQYEKTTGRSASLTTKEKEQAKDYFHQYGISIDCNCNCHRFYTAVNGKFSPQYIPNDLFRARIEPALNHVSLKKAWADKNIYERLFPETNFPRTIIHNINGFFYDSNNQTISRDKAMVLLKEYPELVIKKAIESGGGKGIAHVQGLKSVEAELAHFGNNYIVQEVLHQHSSLSRLNTSSVNIVRIITLRLSDEAKILSSTLRIGAPGSFTDNYIDDRGRSMLIVNVGKDGRLSDRAFYASGECRSNTENGESLSGVIVPKHQEMLALAVSLHNRLPYFKMVGWDMTVDDNDKVVVMEYNINSIGVVYYQYSNGPLFGAATDDVLSYVFKKKRI